MAKKKKANEGGEKKQSNLFAFTDSTKDTTSKKEKAEPEKKKKKPEITKKEPIIKEKEKAKPKKEVRKIEKKEKAEQTIPIPEDLYFEGDDSLFGLKEEEIDLPEVMRESLSSKYIRYLIERNEIVTNLERGLLLDVDYDGGQNKAYCKFYDLDTDEIKIWIDTTDHHPYCLSKMPVSTLEQNIDLTNYDGFDSIETVKRMDLLKDEVIELSKIYGTTPLDIGGAGKNIRQIIGSKNAWEADIRYHLNYIYDSQIIPGLVYKIKNGTLEKLDYPHDDSESKKIAEELKAIFKDDKAEIQEFSENNLDIFLTPIPNVKRMAIDIEVNMGPIDYQIPDPVQAKQKVISISFVANDGLKLVYMLERPGFDFQQPHKRFPTDAKVVYFKKEKDLLIETFRLMWKYPIIITFNGDNFDLNYLFHRANKFKIDRDVNPIQVKRGFGFLSKAECDLRKGIHLDIFNFFFNRSISGYAFGGAYESSSLNDISAALLGREKYQFEGEIHELEYGNLSWYNLKDSILTLELTRFNNNLVWNLIILLCRITKMPIHEMVRRQISTWIQNILYFEHRRKSYIIPRRSEISEVKPGGYSKATIEGKTFQGAYVVPPIPGIHFDVVVMDFASLYPSIIKEYNLSYETVQCPHEDCKDNLIKGIPYHVCTHKMGIFAYVVGFFRDIRVKYFKPKSSDRSLSEERRSYFTTIQQALKVFINGSYGVFGSKNFPLFCLPVAESTTGIGQYSIKSTINKAKELDVTVLYGDTDSVFLLNPSLKQKEEITQWTKDELDLDLEVEKTYQFLALSQRKKNYIGIYKDSKYVDLKGLVAKKSNTPEFIKKVFNELIGILKNITNEDEFQKARAEIVSIIRTNLKKIGDPDAFSLEDYVINIGLQKGLDKYVKQIPQHVRAAQDLKKITGKEFQKGEVVSIIKSKGSDGAKVLELAKLQDIDIKSYKSLLQSALEQVLDALGIYWEEIKGVKKMDAFF